MTAIDTETRYIVHLKRGVDKASHLNLWLIPQLDNRSRVIHDYNIIHAFSGSFTEDLLATIRSSSEVLRVEKDIELEDFFHEVVQTESPWGLNRISQGNKLKVQDTLSKTFIYCYLDPDTQLEVRPVNIYVIDSGVRTTHEDFEGRASWGYVNPDTEENHKDDRGHGTAVASVAAGKHCGVSKHANIIACKKSGPHGSEAIACLDYVKAQWEAGKVPSVVNMSFGSPDPEHKYTSLDEATENLIQAGVHVCIAAGNRNWDANQTTPARAKGANTIGSSTIADARSSTSNYGSVLKLFAPGRQINVADYSSDTAYTVKSGTSFASPHVAGLVAYLISLYGNKTPKEMTDYLQATAIKDVLSDIPEGTPNLLANNGFL